MDVPLRLSVSPISAPDEPVDEAGHQLYEEMKPVFLAGADLFWGAGPVDPEPFTRMLLAVAVPVVPALCTALGAWLGSRNGRKVRIKIGDIEAEAQTREQVEELIARAQEIQQEIQQSNQQPKVIP